MPSCPCRWIDLLALAAGSLMLAHAASASASAAVSATDTVSVIPQPATAEVRLLLVHQLPNDAGETAAVLVTPDGRLWAEPESFSVWTLSLPAVTPLQLRDCQWYPLTAVEGLDYRLDAATQELWLDLARAHRPLSSLSLESGAHSSINAVTETGGHLNLDLQYLHTPSTDRISGLGEAAVFNSLGNGLLSFVDDGRRLIRLDTAWSHDWPERMERLTLGDTISRADMFGRALRFGGLQWGTEFSLKPDLVTFPLPSLRGGAALPSSVDVYVNQSLRAHEEVPAGPFELREVPVTSGPGEVQLVVKDLLGRSQVISYPFYVSPQLLQPGLADYSLSMGALRRGYGFASADYGEVFAALTLRQGLDSGLTRELHAELKLDQQTAGAGYSGVIGQWGSWSAGTAASHADDGVGLLGTAAVEHHGRGWNFALQVQAASAEFAQVGEKAGSLRQNTLLRLGFALGSGGSLLLSHLDQDRRDMGRIRISSLGYSVALARDWYLNAALARTAADTTHYSATLALTHSFGGGVSAGMQHDQASGGSAISRVTVQQDAAGPLGASWRVGAEQGDYNRGSAGLRVGTEKGSLSADAESIDSRNNLRLGYTTGWAWLGPDIFWSRPVGGSFAVVDTGQVAGVRVYQDNHLTGLTDREGVLLVPDLRAYQHNALRIEDADIPLGYEVGDFSAELTPPARSGLRLAFAVHDEGLMRASLRQLDGSPVPSGATVWLDGKAQSLPVALDGLIYLPVSQGHHELALQWPAGRCGLQFQIGASGPDLQTRPLICSEALQ